jgi:Tol biopolymer transport system component
LIVVLLVIVQTPTSRGQVREERVPDISDKALITKEKPATPARERAKKDSADAVKQYTIEQFMATTRVAGASFTHDEKAILFHSNKSGIFNVYRVPVKGGEPQQLTHSTKESTFLVSAFPHDDRFLYRYDKGGNENEHIYLREKDGSERDLTPGDKTKATFIEWSADRKSFFFTTNQRDPKMFDLYEMNISDLKPVLVYQNEQAFEIGDVSHDKRYLALNKPGKTTADSDVYLHDLETKETKNITAHDGTAQNSAQTFDPQSKYLYYLSNEGAEFMAVVRHELATGRREVVEKGNWDAAVAVFSRNGKYRVIGWNEDARTRLDVVEVESGKPVELPKLPDGDITGIRISDSEEQLAFYHNGSRSPGNLFVYDLGTKKLTKLTESLNPGD